MMKKIIFILLLSIAAIACKKDKDNLFSISTNIIRKGPDQSTYNIWIKNSTDWSAIIPDDAQSWLSHEKVIVKNDADTCILFFKENNSLLERRAEVRLKNMTTGSYFNVDVKQSGQAPRYYFSPSTAVLGSGDTEASLLLTLNADVYEVDYKASWINGVEITNTDDIYKKNVKLTLQENTNIGFREDSVVYKVKWTALDKTERVSLKVMQLGVGDLESDKANLEVIYNKLGGSSWSSEYRWDLSQDIRTWNGVTVAPVGSGAGERVVGLQLSGAGLVGDVPSEIINLPYLKVLWLDKNIGVTGSIPTNIGDLLLMENLRFGHTSIKGTLPASISRMVGLSSLSINDTGDDGVSGALPGEYSSLVNLITLDVSDNNLSGTLPDGIGALKLLQNINVSGNDFSGVIPRTYINNYMWPYWGIEVNVCPQRGSGFSNCSL